MNLRKVLWWAAFFAVGICLQRAIPGIDVLAAGLLVVLQERRGWRVFWFPAGLPDVYQLHFLTPKPAIFPEFPPVFAILSGTQEV